MTPSDQLAINTWLHSSRNYDEGLKLLAKHSRNPAIGRMFEGREHRYANKLAYEISKLLLASGSLEKPSMPKPVKPVALIKPIPSAIDLQDALAADPYLPAILVRVIAEFSSKYKNRSMAHYALKAIAPDNRPESVEYRRIIVGKIGEYTDRMDELHVAHQNWMHQNIIPDELRLYPPKLRTIPKPDPSNPADLLRARMNLMKSLNKDQNMLAFGSISKQPVANEMRDGPKKTELKKRIALKIKKIAELTTRINDTSQNI